MKQYVTMLPMESGGYRFVEKMNHKFGAVAQILSNDFRPGELINWLMDDTKTSTGNEWVSIDKERGVIALYDVSASIDETYTGVYCDFTKRFDISIKNFAEILFTWEELRVSKPDIILIVIHENNHVALETDPYVIKEYQDAGYAFDFNKIKGIQEYLLLHKTSGGYFESEFHNATSLLYFLEDFFIQAYPPKGLLVRPSYISEHYVYHNKEKDIMYIGIFEWADRITKKLIPDKDEIPHYVTENNSLHMPYANYKELIESWLTIQDQYYYAVVYRDETDWIRCQGFDTQEEALTFIKEYKS